MALGAPMNFAVTASDAENFSGDQLAAITDDLYTVEDQNNFKDSQDDRSSDSLLPPLPHKARLTPAMQQKQKF